MKYALIGCGRISKNHILAAKKNNLEVVAICDINPDKMKLLKEARDISGKINEYSDYKKMINENKLDLVSIATESSSHASIALYCIDHGINVIVEKPVALSIADVDEMILNAKKNNVKVSVCHQNRFNIAVMKTRQAIEQKRLGKISHGVINIRWNRNMDYYKQATWRGTWQHDGGALMNQCIHGIDLIRWMLGGEIDEVYGIVTNRLHSYLEVEDLGTALIKFKNGAIGTIEGTTNIYKKNLEETLSLFGENGTIKLGGTSANTIDIWELNNEIQDDYGMAGLNEIIENVYGNGHVSLFADVIDSIQSNRKPYVDIYDGRDALELVLAIYMSHKYGKPIKLPISDFSTNSMLTTTI